MANKAKRDKIVAAAEMEAVVNLKNVFSSGATSSERKFAYHLIPHSALAMLAARFSLGAEIHGDVNYQACVQKKNVVWMDRSYPDMLAVDLVFIRDRYNHMLEHLLNLKHITSYPFTREDDLGGLFWGAVFFSWLRGEMGLDDYINRILTPSHSHETYLYIDLATGFVLVKCSNIDMFEDDEPSAY